MNGSLLAGTWRAFDLEVEGKAAEKVYKDSKYTVGECRKIWDFTVNKQFLKCFLFNLTET
jgi:hypothetical protein